MIFIRTGNIQNLIALFYRIIIGIGIEETRTFPNDLGPAVQQQAVVTCKLNVLPNSMHYIRTDMDLLITEIRPHRAARKNIIHIEKGAGVISQVLALPGIERPKIPVFSRLAPRAIQRVNPVHHQIAGNSRITVQKKRQHEHLCIPEYRALVDLAG
ncbi:hypothetical protein D3C74_364590 [compost metagenome]